MRFVPWYRYYREEISNYRVPVKLEQDQETKELFNCPIVCIHWLTCRLNVSYYIHAATIITRKKYIFFVSWLGHTRSWTNEPNKISSLRNMSHIQVKFLFSKSISVGKSREVEDTLIILWKQDNFKLYTQAYYTRKITNWNSKKEKEKRKSYVICHVYVRGVW